MFRRAAKLLLATAALGLCLGVAVVSYRLYTKPELRRALEATRAMIELRRAGENDPGARAMRAAGCEHAYAMPSAEFARLLREIDPAVHDREPARGAPGTIVGCKLGGDEGQCDELARAYVGGLDRPPLTFAFMVETESGAPLCKGIYSQSGRRVRAIVPGEEAVLPDSVSSASRRR